MPGFLNPLILAGLVLAGIPVLIHLLTRHRLKRIEFSSLYFLQKLDKTKIRQVKLKNLLLLILRVLIVALVVLAFARPSLKGELSGLGKAAASSLVILLDDSYSMGLATSQGTLFELAQKKCMEIISQVSSQDRCAVIFAGSPPESTSLSRDFHRVEEEIVEAQVSFASANFGRSLELAEKLLEKSPDLNRELYLLSNKTPNGLENLTRLKEKSRLYFVPSGAPDAVNASVDKVDFGGGLIELGRPFTAQAEIVNYGSKPLKDLLVGFYLDGRKTSQVSVDLKPAERKLVSFQNVAGEVGFHSGWVELAPDDLPADNYRYFTFRIPDQIKVLVAGNLSADNRLLELALRPEAALNQNLKVTSVSAEGLARENFSQYDLVISNDIARFSPATVGDLWKFAEAGGGLWFILGEKAELSFYAQNIASRFFSTSLSPAQERLSNSSGFYQLEKFDLRHPVFSPYRELAGKDLPHPKFFLAHSAASRGNSKILAYFSGGKPALIESSIGRGKGMLFLSGLDPASSEVSRHPFFVPWVNRLVGYLAQDLSAQNQTYSVGEVLQRKIARLPGKEGLELVYPDASKEDLAPVFTSQEAVVKISNTRLPGLYQIRSQNEVLDVWGVNVETRESQPQKMDLEKIRSVLKDNRDLTVVEVPAGEKIAKIIQRTRFGRELWKEALFFALVLLGVEMWLGKTDSKTTLEEKNVASSG